MEKQCIKCLQIKTTDNFAKQERLKKENYFDLVCRLCRNEEAKLNNQKTKEWINTYKLPCIICKESRKHLIDFHHLDPKQKEINISHYAISGATKFETKKVKLLNEINKCIPLCANCHRDFHHLERHENITFEEYKRRCISST